MPRALETLAVVTPLTVIASGCATGSSLPTVALVTPALARSTCSCSTLRSVVNPTASWTLTLSSRWMPPFRSSPRWMRSASACFSAVGVIPWGMPIKPTQNTTSTATMNAVLPFRFLPIAPNPDSAEVTRAVAAGNSPQIVHSIYSSGVVTAAMALFTNSSLILSGGTRSWTTSSFTETIVPRMPPLVVTRSPFFSWLSICCHFFCFLWFGAIIRKYISTKNTTRRSGCRPIAFISIPSFLHLLLQVVARRWIAGARSGASIKPAQPCLESLQGKAAGGESPRSGVAAHREPPGAREQAQPSKHRVILRPLSNGKRGAPRNQLTDPWQVIAETAYPVAAAESGTDPQRPQGEPCPFRTTLPQSLRRRLRSPCPASVLRSRGRSAPRCATWLWLASFRW